LIDLRSTIAYGKARDIDFTLVKKILYETAEVIDHESVPRIRKALRTLLENPKKFINKKQL